MGDPYSPEGCAWSEGYESGLKEAKEIIKQDKKIKNYENVIKKIQKEIRNS